MYGSAGFRSMIYNLQLFEFLPHSLKRPHFFNELRQNVPIFELRTCVRPGITGWAQVRAPYAADIEDSRTKLEYDLYYVLRRSLWLDISIMLETAGVALRGRGAR